MTSTANPSWRYKTYLLFEGDVNQSLLSRYLNSALVTLIILNVIAVILESDTAIHQQYMLEFTWFERFSVAVFTIEFILRAWASVEAASNSPDSNFKSRMDYLLSPTALVDLLAIVPFYISLFFAVDLRHLRLLRVMRILKLTHHFKAFNIFVTVLRKELKSISAALLVMVFLIVIAASLMYALENHAQPDVFGSIAQALWWSVVTMTTVGYGDVTPITPAGKAVAVMVMLLGVAFVALPAGMLAGRFRDELEIRRRDLDNHILHALQDGNISENEYQALVTLADKLELQPEDLAQAINFREQQIKPSRCPHCHKKL